MSRKTDRQRYDLHRPPTTGPANALARTRGRPTADGLEAVILDREGRGRPNLAAVFAEIFIECREAEPHIILDEAGQADLRSDSSLSQSELRSRLDETPRGGDT